MLLTNYMYLCAISFDLIFFYNLQCGFFFDLKVEHKDYNSVLVVVKEHLYKDLFPGSSNKCD